MKIWTIALTLAVFAFGGAALAADGDKDKGDKAGNGAEMSLELYQKIKASFDLLYGANSTMLIGAKPPDKAETEKTLRADVNANKDALLKALGSKEALRRELAARALEYCSDKKAVVEALSAQLNSDPDESVRRAIAGTLSKLPDARAVEALIKGLDDASDSVRGVCCSALGNIKDTRATDPLLSVLKNDSKPMVRLLSALALSKVKDAAAMEKLKTALENEKDERVKMAIAGALRALLKDTDKEAAGDDKGPTASEAADELAALAKEMKEVEDKLREDRHDQAVQAQGTGIENKLATLIEKLNKFGGGQGQGKKGEPQQQMQQGKGGGNGKKSGGSPLADSKLGGAVPPGAVNPAMVADHTNDWSKLPPAQRDELMQAYRENIPERWYVRLNAYFSSIAAEEAKQPEK